MPDRTPLVVAAASALALAACATTTFQSTWRNPAAGPLGFAGQKVVAMVVVPEMATRRGAEQELAAALTRRGAQGVPAYSLIPAEEIKDKDKVKARMEKEGVAGVVVLQLTSKDQDVTSSGPAYMSAMYGGSTYGSFYGGWYGWGWGMPVYSPGYVHTETQFIVETLVYSLKQDKLVWAGQSKSTNPSRVDSMILEIVAGVAADLQKAGLIKKG